MHYFEKVFDGQVLKWCVNGAELGGGKPTLLCLVSNETEAEMRRSTGNCVDFTGRYIARNSGAELGF